MPKTYIVVNAVRREDVPASGAYLESEYSAAGLGPLDWSGRSHGGR